MNSFSSISVMISVLLINENCLNVNGECLPEGCWYDIASDKTLDIICEDSGNARIDYYDGNNGCNDLLNYLDSFRSDVINDCCTPKIECNNVYDCDTEDIHWRDGWYCGSDNICIPDNSCFDPAFPSNDICFEVGTCAGGCICDALDDDDNNHGVCVPANNNLEETLSVDEDCFDIYDCPMWPNGDYCDDDICAPSNECLNDGQPVRCHANADCNGLGDGNLAICTCDGVVTGQINGYTPPGICSS